MMTICYFCTYILIGMYVKLFVVWFLAVVSFFVLWALLAHVIKRISEKRQQNETASAETDEEKKDPES